MQVLENAVRKLKLPSGEETAPQRIEPKFETAPAEAAEPSAALPTISAVRASGSEGPRAPLFSDLPEPEFEDSMRADRSHSGGGGGGGDHRPEGEDRERRYGMFATLLGAAASLALIVGVSVWTYKLGLRDAADVPIVAALEGPARVAPGEPGGLQLPHQGHSVNLVLEGNGVDQVASNVALAPRDEGLTEEDAAPAELSALVASRAPRARPADEASAAAEEARLQAELAQAEPLTPNGTVVQPRTDAPARVEENVAAVALPQAPGQSAETPVPQTRDLAEQTAALRAPEANPQTGAALPPRTDLAEVSEPLATGTEIAAAAPAPATEQLASAAPSEAPAATTTAPGEPTEVATATPPADEASAAAEEAARNVEVAALGPLPPLGEGSAYAPATLARLPLARPRNLDQAMATAVNAALETVLSESAASPDAASAAPVETADTLDVIPLPDGTRMIQLGAYGSEAIARQQWDSLSSQHDDLLGSKAHYVQRTNNSGKIFYRLRVAGYDTREDTQAACAALSARGLPCITVTLR